MRMMLLATVAALVLSGPALAEGGASGGFSPPPSPFVTWQQEGATGKHLKPLSQQWVHDSTGHNAYANSRSGVLQEQAGGPNAQAPSLGG